MFRKKIVGIVLLFFTATVQADDYIPFAYFGVHGRSETDSGGDGRVVRHPAGILGGYKFTWWALTGEFSRYEATSGSGNVMVDRARHDFLAGFRFLTDYSESNLRAYAVTLAGVGLEIVDTTVGSTSRRDKGQLDGLFGAGVGADVCVWKGLRFELEGRLIGTSGFSGGWYPEAVLRVGYEGSVCPHPI